MSPKRSDTPPADLQRVLDAILDGVVVLSVEGVVEQLNAEACRMLETSAELAPGQPLSRLVAGDHEVLQLAREVQKSRQPVVEDDVPLQRRFGSPLQVDLAVSPVSQDPRVDSGVVVLLRDRTLFNTLRQEAEQRDRLASYGQIAAGIAHEVKNPLGGIRGAAELLELRSDDDRVQRAAKLIVREVDRITDLVEELMVFAKGEELHFEQQNVHRLLDHVIELMEADPLAVNVRFDRIYDPSIPDVWADRNRLTQVFLNLVRNSVQAMDEGGGTLRITTRMALQHRVVGEDGRPVPTLAVTVEDDGPGIAPGLLDRLATPFFTTRPKGTGLGLAVSRHWVTRHGGRLEIEPGVESGVRVRVVLPLDARSAAGGWSQEAPDEPAEGRSAPGEQGEGT